MKTDIILSGVGGQGILSIAAVIGEAAIKNDLYMKQAEVHGMSQRGTNTLKPATLETGAEIKVPLFINEGDVLKIDTRTGEYLSRA